MAYLGRYYADKIRGAAELAVFRADGERRASHQKAVDHLTEAAGEREFHTLSWAAMASSSCALTLMSKTASISRIPVGLVTLISVR